MRESVKDVPHLRGVAHLNKRKVRNPFEGLKPSEG